MIENSAFRSANPSLRRRFSRVAIQIAGIVFITILMGELATRWVLGMHPLTPPSIFFQYHPRWGWHHRPGAEGTFVKLGFSQSIRINSLGLREREIPHDKAKGVVRVLVLGDSAVAGFEVPPESVFPRVTEDVLRARGHRVEFINAGVRAYGTDQSLLFLMDEGMKYQPDLVLYWFTGNDPIDNVSVHRPYRKYGKSYFTLSQGGELELRGVPVPDFSADEYVQVADDGEIRRFEVEGVVKVGMWARDQLVVRSALAASVVFVVATVPQLTRHVLSMSSFGDGRGVRPDVSREGRLYRVTSAMVRKMRDTANAGGAHFRVIGNVDAESGWGGMLAEDADLPILGAWAEFRESLPDDVQVEVRFDPHWNEFGHAFYAKILARTLEENGLLEPLARAPAAAF